MDAQERIEIRRYERALVRAGAVAEKQLAAYWAAIQPEYTAFCEAKRIWLMNTSKARERMETALYQLMARIDESEYVRVKAAERRLRAAMSKAKEELHEPLPSAPAKPKAVVAAEKAVADRAARDPEWYSEAIPY